MKEILVVGAGPAGLMAAEAAARAGARVTLFDGAASPARKFLLAGRGGLNLTHSEPREAFLARYEKDAARLAGPIEAFPPEALREWSAELGEPTFVGSSGRIFPRSFKASPLLRAWLRRLSQEGVRLLSRRRWIGFREGGGLAFQGPEAVETVNADAVVLALGGASWPKLGGDGVWVSLLQSHGIRVAPLQAANSGFRVEWSTHLRDKFAGAPLKNVTAQAGGEFARGEMIVSARGLEGGAVYALSRRLRTDVGERGEAMLILDLKPDVSELTLAARLASPRRKRTTSEHLRKTTQLAPVAIALLREIGPLPDTPERLAARIKRLPLRLVGVEPIDRAISSAGGIAWEEIDETFMLRKAPGIFVAGEMIDWDAPTGGFLLQAAFSTGRAAGISAAAWAQRQGM